MTLVELMVALVIGLGIVLATTTMLTSSESHKRVTTSTNDAEQTGAYAFYELQKVLNGAGSAIAESAYPSDRGVLGCRLNAAGNGVALFPRTAAFPAPFNTFLPGVTNTLVVAPLLIAAGQSAAGSDVIVAMGGSGAAGGVSRQVTAAGSATTIVLDNTVGFNNQDVLFISQSGVPDCLLEEVGLPIAPPVLTVSGTTYYTPTAVSTNLLTLAASTSSYVTPIGNAAANNMQFMLFGVGADRTLYSYDLLQNLFLVGATGGDTAQAIADGVVQMNAIYGVDTNGDGIQDAWAGPTDPGWDIATVMANPALMRQIVSVRVALVVRGEYFDNSKHTNAAVTAPTLTIFPGLTNAGGTSLQQVIALNATDQQYRYRIFEFTVPLRNMILLATGGA
jgi:type IV pilus assembly protein PilW